MNKLVILLTFGVALCRVCSQELNEDELRDRTLREITPEKRALCNTIASSGSVAKLAGSFVLAFGKRAIDCVDSCDYTTPSFPRLPGMPNNFPQLLGKRSSQSQWMNKPNRDIIFVIDDSGSIPRDQFEVAKRSSVLLANSFCPQKLGRELGTKQIAVVLFSSSARTEISFEDSHGGANFVSTKIVGLQQAEGMTATTAALRHVRQNVLGKGASRLNDPNTSTHVILVTDGQCNVDCHELKQEAEALRKAGPGVQLFALGVANARGCELDIITGNGKELAFGVSDFNSFEKFAQAIKDEAATKSGGCI